GGRGGRGRGTPADRRRGDGGGGQRTCRRRGRDGRVPGRAGAQRRAGAMAAGARLTKRGASVMRRIDPQDESNDDRQIVLDGPPPTEIAEWLASAGAPDTAEDRRWLTSEYRTGGPGRARAVLGGVVMLAVVAATVVVA